MSGPDADAPARTVPSPWVDPAFAGLVRELWEWTGRPVDRRDPQGRSLEDYLERLARRIGARLTETLLSAEARAEMVRGLEGAGASPSRLTVRAKGRPSEIDAALALPWELLAPSSGHFPVRKGDLDLVRETVIEGAPGLDQPTGPLRVAVSIAAPEDRPVLPYEEEALRLQAALSPLGSKATFAELGGVGDLVELVAGLGASAIHFSGHGLQERLIFENGLGFAEEVPVEELMRRLRTVLLNPGRPGSFPRLFFLSSSYRPLGAHGEEPTSEAGEGPRAAAALHRAGFSQVIGWSGPADGDLRTRMEEAFYGALAAGRSGTEAARAARATLGQPLGEDGSRIYPLGWAQLALYLRESEADTPLAILSESDVPPPRFRHAVEVSGLPVLEQGFIGRRYLQHEVRRRIERHNGQRLIVFQGLGGLGKTALASQLLVRVFAPKVADQLILRCRDLEDATGDPVLELRGQAEEHGRLQALPFWDERVKDLRERIPDPAAGLAAVIRALREKRPNLVVYADNAESLQIGPATNDPGALGTWRPGTEAWWSEMERLAEEDGCLVLASTRYAWEGLSPRAHVGVGPMSPADSLRLIDSFEALRDLPRGVRTRLAERVDGHPRTVEFLDRLVAQRREEMAGREITGVWGDWIAPILPAQEEKIRADLLLEELWKRLSEEAREHARKLTVLRRPAPQFVIDRLGGGRDELIRTGWLTRYRDAVLSGELLEWVDRWGLHSVSKGAIREILQPEPDESQAPHRIAGTAWEDWSLGPQAHWGDVAEAIYHLHTAGEGDKAWPTVERYVLWLRERAHYQEAAELLRNCEPAGTSGERLAESLHLLGLILIDQGHYEEAENLLMRCLSLKVDLLGTTHCSYGALLQLLGGSLLHQGRYDNALAHARASLEILETLLGPDHSETGASSHLIGTIFTKLGKYGPAEDFLRRGKDIAAQSLGSSHPFHIIALNELAWVVRAQGRIEEAGALYRQALVLSEAPRPGDSPYFSSLRGLAGVLQNQGRYEEAEDLLRRCMEDVQEIFGNDHPRCVELLGSLAASLGKQGCVEEAEVFYRRAISLLEHACGMDHPDLGPLLSSLASLLASHGRAEEAEPLLTRAIALVTQSQGMAGPEVGRMLGILAQIQYLLGRPEALATGQKAFNVLRESLGDHHPVTQRFSSQLAVIQEQTLPPEA